MPPGTLCGRPGRGKVFTGTILDPTLKRLGTLRTAEPLEKREPLRAATRGAWRHPVDRPYENQTACEVVPFG